MTTKLWDELNKEWWINAKAANKWTLKFECVQQIFITLSGSKETNVDIKCNIIYNDQAHDLMKLFINWLSNDRRHQKTQIAILRILPKLIHSFPTNQLIKHQRKLFETLMNKQWRERKQELLCLVNPILIRLWTKGGVKIHKPPIKYVIIAGLKDFIKECRFSACDFITKCTYFEEKQFKEQIIELCKNKEIVHLLTTLTANDKDKESQFAALKTLYGLNQMGIMNELSSTYHEILQNISVHYEKDKKEIIDMVMIKEYVDEKNELEVKSNDNILDKQTIELLDAVAIRKVPVLLIEEIKKYFIKKEYNEYILITTDLNKRIESLIRDFCTNELNQTQVYEILYDIIHDTNRFEYVDYNDIEDEFESVNWEHIITAMQYQLYPSIANAMKKVISGTNIQKDDFSEQTIKTVLDMVGQQHNLSQEQIVFMNKLIQNALIFDPITQDSTEQMQNYMRLDNGIIYWLGTDKNKTKWGNPANCGYIKVISNAEPAWGSSPLSSIVDKDSEYFLSKNEKHSWILIDFLNIQINPSYYSLRHYSRGNTMCLRNWYLEASNNGSDWIRISDHINDESLNKKGDIHKWKISKDKIGDNTYSKFRIFQFDVNSSNTYQLAIGGFEIYGIAQFDVNLNERSVNKVVRTFMHQSDNDNNGLMYYLGTFGDNFRKKQVSITSSPLSLDSNKLSTIIQSKRGNCYTKSVKDSFIALELEKIEFKLKKYSLRNNDDNKRILRNWNLEGSTDGINWIIIRRHKLDSSLTKRNQIHTWDVDTNQFFSHFRIHITGKNNYDNYSVNCAGIELYGDALNCIFNSDQHIDENKIKDTTLKIDSELLMDIYSVHKCFLYTNYAFKEYTISDYIDAMNGAGYFDSSINQQRCNFEPYFRIDDDIYCNEIYICWISICS
eukprot:18073_1